MDLISISSARKVTLHTAGTLIVFRRVLWKVTPLLFTYYCYYYFLCLPVKLVLSFSCGICQFSACPWSSSFILAPALNKRKPNQPSRQAFLRVSRKRPLVLIILVCFRQHPYRYIMPEMEKDKPTYNFFFLFVWKEFLRCIAFTCKTSQNFHVGSICVLS